MLLLLAVAVVLLFSLLMLVLVLVLFAAVVLVPSFFGEDAPFAEDVLLLGEISRLNSLVVVVVVVVVVVGERKKRLSSSAFESLASLKTKTLSQRCGSRAYI